VDLRLPVEAASVPKARHAVARLAEGCAGDSLNVATAVTEAVSNAVLHAYRDGAELGEIRVVASVAGAELKVVVEDSGVGMKPNPDSEGLGLGSMLIKALSQEVSFSDCGSGVRLTMRFPCAAVNTG
jgi:anti-sigma regulatory factor (Ser/Thr protein kinase)